MNWISWDWFWFYFSKVGEMLVSRPPRPCGDIHTRAGKWGLKDSHGRVGWIQECDLDDDRDSEWSYISPFARTGDFEVFVCGQLSR